MRIHLYIDEDSMSRALVRALRARDVDVTTALDANMIEQPDTAHLDYATAQGRVLYSFNVGDYFQLHSQYLTKDKPHGGIIVSRQQTYSVGEQLRRLLKLIATKSAEDMQNHIEFLGHWG
ncbi:MAG: hypothetical protein GY796_21470 [Chloroflexi bacterium]|nr:hypothetical protein [Chloroflexota bacterium]